MKFSFPNVENDLKLSTICIWNFPIKIFYTDYSVKSILIPSQKECKLQLISSAGYLLNRKRSEHNERETHGFKSQICPQNVDQLSKFEEDLIYIKKYRI